MDAEKVCRSARVRVQVAERKARASTAANNGNVIINIIRSDRRKRMSICVWCEVAVSDTAHGKGRSPA